MTKPLFENHPINLPQKREYHLDWIRCCVVLILVPFHTAVSFSHIGKGYVYTAEPVDSWMYIFISDFFNLWIMRLLFFVSGFSAFFSLRKRTAAEFVKDRFERLILPVLFLLLTLGPLSGYILAISRDGFTDSFPAYYPHFFLEAKEYLFWGHMWYCVYLFIFSLTFLPLFSLLKMKPSALEKINSFLAEKNRFLLPMILIVFFEALLRPSYPGYQSFIGDWANVAVHSSFFLLGFILAGNSEFSNMLIRKARPLFFAALCSTVLYLLCKRFFFRDETQGQTVLISALWGIAAYTWVFFFIGFMKKHLSRNGSLLKYLSQTSFALYLFHYLILSLFNFALIGKGLPHYAVFLLTTLGTYIAFALLFELLIKNCGMLRRLCGLGYKEKR